MARKLQEGQLGLFKPDSDWVRPAELPDLRGRPYVVIDGEGRDDGLASGRGPGWAIGPAGYMSGFGWATEGSQGYAPIRHPETDNFPEEAVVRWLDDLYASGTKIIFHNAPFDCGWTSSMGIRMPVNFEDTLAACVMTDETQREYNLDACAIRAGIPGKDQSLLRDAVLAYGGTNVKKPQAEIWRVPAKYAAPYAEADCVATLRLWQQTEGMLRANDLWDAYRTEIDLIPMTVAMRRRGIRINTERALKTADHFRVVRDRYLKEIGDLLGLRRPATTDQLRSPRWMEQKFFENDIKFPRTVKSGQGSFSKEWMEKHDHPLPRAVVQALKYEEAASKFIDNYILGFSHRGRIHAEIHQFLSESGGTRSHRFSYSDPPLQQMTSPDKDPQLDLPHDPDDDPKLWRGKGGLNEDLAIGTKLRAIFEPDPGTAWLASDYSQQEPRITVHFAALCKIPGVEEALERYRSDPNTDYHTMVSEMTGLPRPRAKILNLAMTYGKGKHSTAEELNVPLDEAEGILKMYHERLPYIKPLEDLCKRKAQERGYIRLIDGARMHYNEWEGGWMEYEERKAALAAFKKLTPCSLEEARERQKDPDHPWSKTRLRRADTRKALNNLVQGSAARQTKRAMLEMWRQGLIPYLQMHDELDNPVSSQREIDLIDAIMKETTPLLVPIKVDNELGPNWGHAKTKGGWEGYVKKYGDPAGRRAA